MSIIADASVHRHAVRLAGRVAGGAPPVVGGPRFRTSAFMWLAGLLAAAGIVAVAPTARANLVVYRHRGVSEWYANGPLGLEQGFTLAAPPAGRRVGPLTLTLALSSNAHVSVARGGDAVTFTRGRTSLSYRGLVASDARGHTLPARIELAHGKLLLRVSDAGARYPIKVDPFVQRGGKLTASDEAGAGEFGLSVALSSDGNTAVVGGPADNNVGGAAWVFTRSGQTWTQQGAQLRPNDEDRHGGFGESLALSSDGNTALIGGPTQSNGVGAAWVFTRSGQTWTQQGAKLTASNGVGDQGFGKSVALSSDGNTALIGSPFDVGAAWVFTRSGQTWTQQGANLTASDEAGSAEFGFRV